MPWARWLQERFRLTDEERVLLLKPLFEQTPKERRLYRRRIAPRLVAFAAALRQRLAEELHTNPQAADEWATTVAVQVVSRGSPTLLETLLIDVVGRPRVARRIEQLKQGRVAAGRGRMLS